MTHGHDLTLDEIESTVARAREERAEAIRTGAASLNVILKHVLAGLRRTRVRA